MELYRQKEENYVVRQALPKEQCDCLIEHIDAMKDTLGK